MADTRYWSKDFMTDFIEVYKSFPCLWKVKSKEYTNKNLKNEAYEKLVALCKGINPDCNRDFVVKKIQSLRGSFRKEMKKLLDSKRSGNSSDDVYVPSLWYFDLLLFTKDQELPTSSISNCNETSEIDNYSEELDQGHVQEDTFASEIPQTIDSEENRTDSEIINTSSTIKRTDVNNKKGKKRSYLSAESIEFMEMCKDALNPKTSQSEGLTEFEAVGVSVAKKLQRMDHIQAIFAESIINVVLRKGLLNHLSDRTILCDGQCADSLTSPQCSRPRSVFSNNSEDISQTSNSIQWQQRYSQFTAVNNDNSQNLTVNSQVRHNNTAATFYDNATDFINTA